MKNPVPLMAVLLFISSAAISQKDTSTAVLFKSGSFRPIKNINASSVTWFNQRAAKVEGKSFAAIQFEKIPSAEERNQLAAAGIELLEYIPNNTYTVSVTKLLDSTILKNNRATSLFELTAEQKMHPQMAKGILPSWSVKVAGTVDVWISFPKTLSFETVSRLLSERNFDITSDKYKEYRIIALRIGVQRITELASLPFIEYVEPAPHEDQPLNYVSRNNSRANVLNASASIGGRNLKGQGIVIGVGDNANALYHVDFSGRIIDRAAMDNSGNHGVHVHGTAAGGGIKEEKYTGYAPKATVVSQLFNGVFVNAGAYITDYNMVITNNSYGAIIGDCDYNGLYDLYSRILDLQAFSYPSLQNVFAAGNSGASTCAAYPTGFKTVLGGYQSAKNVISVGNTFNNGNTIAPGSSRGPVKDGRIKPEITAMGFGVISAWNTNTYSPNNGTSMASPAVSGGLALLYQRYRQLHSNADPKSGLMKALVCNGGRDLGNEGPDYKFGYGWLNLLRSVDMLENNRYFTSSIANAVTNTHTVTVPSIPEGTAQLKVMLYWHDPAAAVLAARTLVNDLDLEITTPAAAALLPRLLDTIPANVNNVAGTGADHINNMEQIVINNPQAGNYTIRVKGTAITQNPSQEYFLVYDIIPVSTILTYPIGGEAVLPGEDVTINWDSYGEPANNFTIQISTDNGNTWVDSVAAADLRQLNWKIPAVTTEQARVRIKRDGTALQSTSQAFTIVGVPAVSLAAVQCEGYISVNWTAVAGATQYEVMQLKGDEMVSVFITADASVLNYTISGLSKDSTYWVSVRAIVNGKPGRRGTAISYKPSTGSCAGTISDNDLKADAILTPVSGRKFSFTELTVNETLTVRIKNLDDLPATNFTVRYRINGGAWISQNILTPLPGNSSINYTFNGIDLSAVNNYVFDVEVINNAAADPVSENNILSVTVKQIDNQPINLTTAFLDNFETAAAQSYASNFTGLQGIERYDFSTTAQTNGRVRSFVNTGISYSGAKALTLDANLYNPAGVTNFLAGTYNIAAYNVASDDIRLDFRYKSHGQPPHANNKVWIRGNDNPSTPWIPAYDLYANQENPGVYKLSSSIEVSDLLAANGQAFSPSFQARWGQFGVIMATDNENANGYTFDDIRLYKVIDDIQLLSVDTPISASCALGNAVPVKVSVRNSANTTINNIPVKLRVDGGAVITEAIASIAGNATIQYTFTATANLSSTGNHTIEVWVDLPTDTYPDNNLKTAIIINAPVITSFPHLQNFETGNGSWYTAGKNSSWEYGTPSSNKINTAASGSKAWKTRLSGNYNDQEKSYLYSPCYNITGMANPTLSFSLALDFEDCGTTLCDGAYVEYSADGKTWLRLGSNNSGTNWYNKAYAGNHVWSIENYTRWHVATIPLPLNIDRLRLRFVVESDPYVNKEGIAIDDIHIYDNTLGIYDGVTMTSPVTQNISGGNSWINFISAGKLVASIQPNNQAMGNTEVQAYINTAPVRADEDQYYHDRNITIKPTNFLLADSATVRFYFLDTEAERLINATGCANCTKTISAYQLGVPKYSDINDGFENGTIADNGKGLWSFISQQKRAIVPFDKGYYAEFKVSSFSEFWLKKEEFKRVIPPAVQVTNFKAIRQTNNDVLVQWTTTVEGYVNRFEVEVAKGNDAYQTNNFIKIGEVSSMTNAPQPQTYSFTDAENNKTGVRYYRLKIVNNDGSFFYSEVQPVVFEDGFISSVYPNPSDGKFYLMYQANAGAQSTIIVHDAAGKLLQKFRVTASGFVQKVIIDLQSKQYPAGLYLIQAGEGEDKKLFKVIKNR